MRALILWWLGVASVIAQDFRAGQTTALEWEGLADALEVFVPQDYDASKSWPVIFYYHGTNGRPTTRLIRRFTQEKRFIVVGMTYRQRGRFQFSEENFGAEIAILTGVVRRLSDDLKIEKNRAYVAGFSKGGWIAASLVERLDWLAGGMIMGAGVFDKQQVPAKPFKEKKRVYLGIGQKDANFAMSVRAKQHFEKLGAQVTLDEWQGIGHEYPNADVSLVSARQWLEIAVIGVASSKGRANAWLKSERIRIADLDKPLERYLAWRHVQRFPFIRLVSPAQRKEVAIGLEKARQHPKVKREAEIERQFRQIVAKEILNRYFENLKSCSLAYADLQKNHPKTHFGRVAGLHHERTRQMLRNAE